MAGSLDATAALAAEPSSEPAWSVLDDPISGDVIARFPAYVTSEIVVGALAELARNLEKRGRPSVVIVDLCDVEGFDIKAPIVAMRSALPFVLLIDRVDLIVRRRLVRVAALSAAYVLGLRCRVRARRREGSEPCRPKTRSG